MGRCSLVEMDKPDERPVVAEYNGTVYQTTKGSVKVDDGR